MERYPAFLMLLGLALSPGAALACACCAEPGSRFLDRAELSDWVKSEIATLQAEGDARLYLTACGFDCVAGITDAQAGYPVTISAGEDGIALRFGDAGSVRMEWPATYTWFGVDTDHGAAQALTQLYTEMRLRAPLSGDGAFSGSETAELVLAGRGNMCVNAGSFETWTLSVEGEGVAYRVFGRLR